ncbi:SDR family oxidoreductase [Alkanindiges sp. WGS2144]|uniref:SDR family oxidoreductase n=1 Tax=Alkanindiges sp. WGS2144 TaxID=3366808 RepID=UPI003752F66B
MAGQPQLKSKKCFITGAASGIGKATAVAAAQEEAILFLTDIDEIALQETVNAIQQTSGQVAMWRALDISALTEVQAFAEDIHQAYGSMDIIMNIAGIAIWGTVENLQHQQWRRTIDVNLMGPIHVIESFVPAMIKAGQGGHLVNVASAAALMPLPWHAAYSASKFGLRGLSEVLRHDLRHHHIGVSLVCPGAVDTGLVHTIQVAGIDMQHPEAQKLRKRFVRHAVKPEKVASKIIQAVKHNRWMVFTSPDIRIGFWFQRKFAWPYELVMRLLNRQMNVVGQLAAHKPER